jgi:hypothetical protein
MMGKSHRRDKRLSRQWALHRRHAGALRGDDKFRATAFADLQRFRSSLKRAGPDRRLINQG